MTKIPDFGDKIDTINSGGREVKLSCKYKVPGLTIHDLVRIYHDASSQARPEDEYSANPSKWPHVRGVNAVADAILNAVYGGDAT